MAIRARWALAGAVGCIGVLAATWFAAFHVGIVRNADQSMFAGFYDLHSHGAIPAIANFVAPLCSPNPYVYFAPIPVLVALARGRPRVALAVAVILIGANVTTHELKPLLAEPRATSLLGGFTTVGPKSWPSGHATAAMALALSSVIAAPARWRPFVAALGAVFALAVSYSFLTLGWHFPSDVLGGFLVAATWALLAIAGLRAAESRIPRGAYASARASVAETLGPLGVAAAGAFALAALVVVSRPHEVLAYAQGHRAFVVGVAAIAAASFTVSSAIVLTVRR
jgi:membrane-associated phospholipid phosphatase